MEQLHITLENSEDKIDKMKIKTITLDCRQTIRK